MKLKIFKVALVLIMVGAIVTAGLYSYYNKEFKNLDDAARNAASGKFIRLSKGFVHYEIDGPDNGPVIVLVHGAGSGYYAWDYNYAALAKAGFKVLRYDLYGRGLSDRPATEYNLSLFVNQLDELTDSLKIQKPYNVAAVSMGAMVAIEMANKYPEKINKIAFIDPAAIDKGDVNWILKAPIISDLMMTIYWAPRAVDKQMKEFHDPKKVSEYADKSEVHLKYKGLKRAMLSTWIHTSSKNMYKELEEMGKKKQDILLVWGKNDPLTSIKSSVKYRKLIPQIQYQEIEKAGHLSNYEQPEIVNPIMIDFFSK